MNILHIGRLSFVATIFTGAIIAATTLQNVVNVPLSKTVDMATLYRSLPPVAVKRDTVFDLAFSNTFVPVRVSESIEMADLVFYRPEKTALSTNVSRRYDVAREETEQVVSSPTVRAMRNRSKNNALSASVSHAAYDCSGPGEICRPAFSASPSSQYQAANGEVSSSYRRRAFAGMQANAPSYFLSHKRPETRDEVVAMIKMAAANEGVDPEFALALAYLENGYKPAGVSWAGARGPMQVMPGTARQFDPTLTVSQMSDPRVNIPLGMRYLKMGIDQTGSEHIAAARYEAGLGSRRITSSYARKVDSLRRNSQVRAALAGTNTGWSLFSPNQVFASNASTGDSASVYAIR